MPAKSSTAVLEGRPETLGRGWSRDSGRTCPVGAVNIVRLADVVVLVLSLGAALVLPNLDGMAGGLRGFLSMRVTLENVLLTAGFAAGSLAVFQLLGLYDATRLRRWLDEIRLVLAAGTLATAGAAIFPLNSSSGAFLRSSLLDFWMVATAGLMLCRSARRALSGRGGERRRVLVVGTGPQAIRIHRELCSDRRNGYQLLGFVDASPASNSPFLARRTLGTLDDLEPLLVREHIDEVYVGLPVRSQYLQIQETLRICERVGVKATYHADIFDAQIARPRVSSAGAASLVEMQVAPDGWPLAVKRVLDVAGASMALVVLSPLMLAAAVAIKLTSEGPVIYRQERCGLNRRRFMMLKFRTMVAQAERLQASLEALNEVDGPAFKIARDPRITRVGRILRKTSIDELPQLVNVLRGEMSLVGPRPLPLRDVRRFRRPSHMRRFSVRPGLTCLWQVGGRSQVGFDEWVRLDLEYIDGWSLGLDLKVLLKTLPAVLRGTGAA